MTRYLVSFDEGAMSHLSEAEIAEASIDTHRVVADARDAGVWVFGAGVLGAAPSIVDVDGSVRTGPYPPTKAMVGGFCVLDVGSREEALRWAARVAAGCRCAQEVRELMDDPDA